MVDSPKQPPSNTGKVIAGSARSVDEILELPLTPLRVQMASIFREKGAFSKDERDAFIASLPDQDKIAIEKKKATAYFTEGIAPEKPNLSDPSAQLFWAANLAYLNFNPDAGKKATNGEVFPLNKSPLWRSLITSPRARLERARMAMDVDRSLRNSKATIGWGTPGSWFYYHPDSNHVNIDFFFSLLGGFEPVRSVLHHEVGHSQYTTGLPPRIDEIRREIAIIYGDDPTSKNPVPKKQISQDDYLKLTKLSVEQQLVMGLFNAAEDNAVNRYTAHMGKRGAIDTGIGINHIKLTIAGYGNELLDDKGKPTKGAPLPKFSVDEKLHKDFNQSKKQRKPSPAEAQAAFAHLGKAVDLLFFSDNGLFENTPEGWARMGVDINLLRRFGPNRGTAAEDFRHLRNLSAGPNGLQHLLPSNFDRWFGGARFRGKAEDMTERRFKITQEIWDEYAKPYVDVLIEEATKEAKNQMGKKSKKQGKGKGKDDKQQQQQPQQGGSGSGTPQPQQPPPPPEENKDKDKKDDQNQENKGEPNQEGDKQDSSQSGNSKDQNKDEAKSNKPDDKEDKNQPQKGDDDKKDEENSKGGGQKDDKKDDQQNSDGSGDKDKEQDKNKEDKKDNNSSNSNDKKDEKKSGKPKDKKEDQNQEQSDKPDDNKKEKNLDVEGVGDMPEPELPPEDEEKDQEQQRPDKGESKKDIDEAKKQAEEEQNQGKKPEDSRSIEDEINDLKNLERENNEESDPSDSPIDANNLPSGTPSMGSRKAGKSANLAELSKGNWEDYARRRAELAGPIRRVRKLYEDILSRQVEKKETMGNDHNLIPQDNLMERLSRQRHRDFIIKRKTGQPMEEKDLHRFRKDHLVTTPTTADLFIMIDASGSMQGTPMNTALQTSVILYEAARNLPMNVFISVWGDSTPRMLARPGDKDNEIGRALEGVRDALPWGTQLAPALRMGMKEISEFEQKAGTKSGYSHLMVLSDGDIGDTSTARRTIEALFSSTREVTVDAAVIGYEGSQMERALTEGIDSKHPSQQINVIVGEDASKLPYEIAQGLATKMRRCGTYKARADKEKRRRLQRARDKMKP